MWSSYKTKLLLLNKVLNVSISKITLLYFSIIVIGYQKLNNMYVHSNTVIKSVFLLLSLKYFLNTKFDLIMESSKFCNLYENNVQNL